jgi:hypothetical protein
MLPGLGTSSGLLDSSEGLGVGLSEAADLGMLSRSIRGFLGIYWTSYCLSLEAALYLKAGKATGKGASSDLSALGDYFLSLG